MEDGKVMINILYEDNHLLVVEKKVGVLSQSDGSSTPDMLTILKQYIKEKYNKPGNVYLGLVHRLDKNVGGVMVFAKTSKAARRLSEQIRNREFKKTYLAVCKGIIKSDGEYLDYLKRVEYRSLVSNSKEGKLASLTYQALDTKDNNTLVKIKLETGRHHQIRVQFAHHKHPLQGDEKYGSKGKYPLALFAYKLEFSHPTTKENLSFSIMPEEGYFTSFANIIKEKSTLTKP